MLGKEYDQGAGSDLGAEAEFEGSAFERNGAGMAVEAPMLEKNGSAVIPVQLEELGLKLSEDLKLGEQEFIAPENHHVTVLNISTGKIIREALKTLSSDEEREVKRLEIQQLMNEIDWKVSISSEAYHLVQDGEKIETIGKKERKRLQAEAGPDEDIPTERRVAFHKESVIVMAELDGLETFYNRMESELGIDIGDPHPAHITLLIAEGQKLGIGVTSTGMLEEAKNQGATDIGEGLRAYSTELPLN